MWLSIGVALLHPPSVWSFWHTPLPHPCGIFFIFLWVPPSLGLLENVLIKNRMNCWESRTVCRGQCPRPEKVKAGILLSPALYRALSSPRPLRPCFIPEPRNIWTLLTSAP